MIFAFLVGMYVGGVLVIVLAVLLAGNGRE